MTRWQTYEGTIPGLPGVFVVFSSQSKPLFIGACASLSSHIRYVLRKLTWQGTTVGKVKFKVCTNKQEMAMLEARLLYKLKPLLAKHLPTRKQLKQGNNLHNGFVFYGVTKKRMHMEFQRKSRVDIVDKLAIVEKEAARLRKLVNETLENIPEAPEK